MLEAKHWFHNYVCEILLPKQKSIIYYYIFPVSFTRCFPNFPHIITEEMNRLKLHFQRGEALLSRNTSMYIAFLKRLLECQRY